MQGAKPDRKKAQEWEKERKQPKAVGGSVHIHKPTFMGNPLIGTGAINGGHFSTGLSESIISKARGVQKTANLVSPYNSCIVKMRCVNITNLLSHYEILTKITT